MFSSHLLWTSSSLDVPAGVTKEEGHTGFLIHLPSAVRTLIFLARRIQPFLSLVDREVEFCANNLIVLHYLLGIFYLFYSSVRKIPFAGIRTHVPTCQKVTRLLLTYRGDRLQYSASTTTVFKIISGPKDLVDKTAPSSPDILSRITLTHCYYLLYKQVFNPFWHLRGLDRRPTACLYLRS